jgi:hypothetical protein
MKNSLLFLLLALPCYAELPITVKDSATRQNLDYLDMKVSKAQSSSDFTSTTSTATFAGWVDIGLVVKVYAGTTRYSHVACPTGYKAISGGCSSSSGPQWYTYPSTETTSGDGAGTPVADSATNANSWTCATDAVGANTAYAICARIK